MLTQRSKHELRLDHGAEHDLVWAMSEEALTESGVGAIDEGDANVGVEQQGHTKTSASSGGGSTA